MTVCAFKHALLFEDNRIKKIVEKVWFGTAKIRPNMALDEFVVMPNHLHGIIIIRQRYSGKSVGAYCNTPLRKTPNTALRSHYASENSKFRSPSQTIGSIIRGFKASSTRKINIMRKTPGMRVWQRNYYKHVIRNDDDLYRTRKYIRENPLKWDQDEENPDNFPGAKGATITMGGERCTRISRNRSMS